MEIRKQMLGVVIGIFLTMSFIAPAYSKIRSNDNLCNLDVQDLTDILINVKKGTYEIGFGGKYIHQAN